MVTFTGGNATDTDVAGGFNDSSLSSTAPDGTASKSASVDMDITSSNEVASSTGGDGSRKTEHGEQTEYDFFLAGCLFGTIEFDYQGRAEATRTQKRILVSFEAGDARKII